MNEAWKLKKKLSDKMSSPQIAALENLVFNAYDDQVGMRLVGSGGGRGFMLLLSDSNTLHEIF
jgi:galactokinase/mevalonate kinase-like predicted kinase